MNLVLIETSGNQRYIFATNKLRENVGASELTYQIGTRVVVEEVGRSYDYSKDKDGHSLRSLLLEEKRIEKSPDENAIEIIIATSGKALLLVRSRERAEEIVKQVISRALIEMPGLTVHGAIESVNDDLIDAHDAVARVHRKLEDLRHRIPSNQLRFLRLPHVEPCATSGLPATRIYRHVSLKDKPEELKPHSSLSIEKQEKSNEGRDRLEKTIQSVKPNVKLMGNINELETKFKETRWLAIIHADGNGLGGIFLNFADHLDVERNADAKRTFKTTEDARTYIDAYRNFSIALDICTINATGFAIEKFQSSYREECKKRNEKDSDKLPFIPLILGGDDLTVICDGEYALKFVYDFLSRFEERTSQSDIIKQIAKNAFGVERLGICAGAAIVKPHYPFHQAYELAEQLLKSSKQVKAKVLQTDKRQVPCSAMDFHVLYDSSGVELNEIREKLKAEGETYLYAKPYIVTTPSDLEKAERKDWLVPRTWDNLAKRVCAMRATDDDDKTKRKLPNSQMHLIRESLHRGKRETDSEVNLFKHRYSSDDPKKDKGFGKLLCDGDSLFFKEGEIFSTHFLDALDVVDFWKGFGCRKEKKPDETANGNPKDGGEQ